MAQAEVGALRVTLGMNAGEFDRKAAQAGRSFDQLAKKAKQFAATLAGTFVTAGFIGILSKANELWGIQETAIKSVEATLRTTGGTVGFTSKQLQEMASRLQDVSVYGDEEILQKLTNNLLTFGNVVGPVFDRAQKAAIGLSAVLNQDLQSSAIQLGKALNDPILGITALSRVGIAFTLEQKEQIKSFVKANEVMKAQGVILQEIEKFYGDAAKAARETSRGAEIAMFNDLGDALEVLGSDGADLVIAFANSVSQIAKSFQALEPETRKFSTAMLAVTGSLAAVTAGLSLLGVSLGLAAGPITLIIASIGALAGALYAFGPQIKAVAEYISGRFESIYQSAKTYLVDKFRPVTDAVSFAFKFVYDTAKKWLVDAFQPILESIQYFVNTAKSAFMGLADLVGFSNPIAPVTDAIKNSITGVTGAITNEVNAIRDVWIKAGDDGEKAAEEQAPRMAMPMIKLKEEVNKAEQDIRAAQNRLVEEGVRLAENLKTPYDVMVDKVKALQAAQAAGKITAAQYGAAQSQAAYVAQSAYAGMASDITSSLESVFGESKAFAIVSAIINTYEAFTKALAAYPPPFNYAAAGAVLAAGFAKVAAIKRQNKSGGGSGSAGGGGAASSARGRSDSGSGGSTQSLLVQGINPGDLFTGESVRQLAGKLLDFQRDGGRVVLQ